MKKYIYYTYIKSLKNSVFNCRVVRDLQKHFYGFQVNCFYVYSSLHPFSTAPWFTYLCFQVY